MEKLTKEQVLITPLSMGFFSRNLKFIEGLKELEVGEGLKVTVFELDGNGIPTVGEIKKYFDRFYPGYQFVCRQLEAKKGWLFVRVPVGTDTRWQRDIGRMIK